MKLTKTKLKQLIKEELNKLLAEAQGGTSLTELGIHQGSEPAFTAYNKLECGRGWRNADGEDKLFVAGDDDESVFDGWTCEKLHDEIDPRALGEY
jgi:hypothetical protein|tara:strand:+ start:3008 stop:3292 length:285 start_codon:yes stop_codon:yes gene_type:complete